MKINLKSIFGNKRTSPDKSSAEKVEIVHDKHVDFYYTNIINSIILYTFDATKLEEMAPILIEPLTELYEELEYAFTPVCFETVFRLGVIDSTFKNELLEFKKEVDNIPAEIWDWEFIDSHETWITIRNKAYLLLEKLGVANRTYNDDFTTIYDNEGNIIRKGKNFGK
ncbi:hypothetical protein IQ13_3055 [Lacibacter cauensis]|uniref:Uncharacterized protein n=1 Tax=Lacibacter cauensis TaxID=510947 RepID=A0A562SGR7_9BACT|nr:hypothetical protein [Lacibacter cauensis]TWI80378.1 hypothetical protein IQ13_3055 [Lacibacter cauensis]